VRRLEGGLPRILRNRRQAFDFVRDFATSADQIRDQPVVHVEDAFVLGPIPHIVALRQHSPDLRSEAERVRQYLKHDVPFRWPEPAVPECRQTQCVSGTVGEIEPALQRFASFSASLSRARPECTRPANSFASGGSFARTFPGPARRSSGDAEVIFRSNHPDFRLLEHSRHERVFRSDAL
jgi:hypothetical protein